MQPMGALYYIVYEPSVIQQGDAFWPAGLWDVIHLKKYTHFLCFLFVIRYLQYVQILPMSVIIASLALRQSYAFLSASELTLKNWDKWT